MVTICSSAHKATEAEWVRRRVKVGEEWRTRLVRRPAVIHDYNQYMGGVDKSDQLLTSYNLLMKSMRWWKTLFFHMVDVAVLNSYLLFQAWRNLHPEVPELQRSARKSLHRNSKKIISGYKQISTL